MGAEAPLIAGRYRIVRELGAGGMATVFEVVDVANGQALALKRLRMEAEPRRLRRVTELFEREFYTLSQISHPRVVCAYDYGVDDYGPYYTNVVSGSRARPRSSCATRSTSWSRLKS